MYSRKRILISHLLDDFKNYINNDLDSISTCCGWIQTIRKQSDLVFISLNDGSCAKNLQGIISSDFFKDDINNIIGNLNIGTSIKIAGKIIESPAKGQDIEMQIHNCTIIGNVDLESYPLPKTALTLDYLRQIPNFRVRRPIFLAINRIRSQAVFYTHSFMKSNNFINVNTPLITASDCEGAGETFTVSTIMKDNINNIPNIDGKVDYSKDFFGKKVSLTVSGQLHAEVLAHGLSDVYTFGPTFRSENSNTSRHLAEFWMLEIESCFMDLNDLMDFSETYIRFIVNEIVSNNKDDLDLIIRSRKPECDNLLDTLENIRDNDFVRISYSEVISILEDDIKNYKIIVKENYPDISEKDWKKKSKNKHSFEFKPYWGIDLASEHEKYICEIVFKKPCIVYNYPKDIKAFYMKSNEDGKTVQAMDILIPGIGELVGGSTRISDLNEIQTRMDNIGINSDNLSWYSDLRKYGNGMSSGMGMGFERLLMLLTGSNNIKDCISFPRFPYNIFG